MLHNGPAHDVLQHIDNKVLMYGSEMGELHVSTQHISAIYGSRDTFPAKTIPLFQEQEQNTSELCLRSHILQAKVIIYARLYYITLFSVCFKWQPHSW